VGSELVPAATVHPLARPADAVWIFRLRESIHAQCAAVFEGCSQVASDWSAGSAHDAVEQFGNNVPMKRPGQPAELATAYVMLADPLSSYVSGATIAVTGGKPIL